MRLNNYLLIAQVLQQVSLMPSYWMDFDLILVLDEKLRYHQSYYN